jgi:hypothetical protein
MLFFQNIFYQLCALFFFLEEHFCELTDFSEWGKLLPAGDERAGAAHTVALARHLHVADNRLQQDLNH